MMNEMLILVDENDKALGTSDKLSVHQNGMLHRAFSIFVFNSMHELLLQQRADQKYHSGGLWTNTCCGHPRDGEETKTAVRRRLLEEMGVNCDLSFQFSFVYKAGFENGLTEHELDHVYFGKTDSIPEPDLVEVKNWKYMNIYRLKNDIVLNESNYSKWLKICLPQVITLFEQNRNRGLL